MGKIFYSVAGEGRGHATRVQTVVDELRHDHQIVIFAPHMAFDYLDRVYQDTPEVEIRRIPGLQFSYRGRCVSYWSSIQSSLPYLRQLPSLVTTLAGCLKDERPDLVITDFEPALPRAARRRDVPFLSFDHQHFLTSFDLSSLPWHLRLKARSIAATINLFYQGQNETIVSSFFSPGVRPNCRSVTSVGVMVRRDLRFARTFNEDFLLVYLRRFAPPLLMEALQRCGRPVKIYGLGEQSRDGNLRYLAVSETGFQDDLKSCYALISNAGNQLVGEALSLRKPVLALPEEGNFEQSINAHFLTRSGYGLGHDAAKFNDTVLGRFLEHVPAIRERILPETVVGNSKAFATINRYLPTPAMAPTNTLARVA